MVNPAKIALIGNGVVGVELHKIAVLPRNFSACRSKFPCGESTRQIFVQVIVVLVISISALYSKTLYRCERKGEGLGGRKYLARIAGLFYGNVGVVER